MNNIFRYKRAKTLSTWYIGPVGAIAIIFALFFSSWLDIAQSVSAKPVTQSQAPTDVSISGPTEGIVGTVYIFSSIVNPATAEMPIAHDWRADEQAPVTNVGGITDTVSYSWSEPGLKTITVEVANTGGSANATHTIEIATDTPITPPPTDTSEPPTDTPMPTDTPTPTDTPMTPLPTDTTEPPTDTPTPTVGECEVIDGRESCALGDAQVTQQDGSIVISNIGSSGQDGVSIDLDNTNQWDLNVGGLDSEDPIDASFSMITLGEVNGISGQLLNETKLSNKGNEGFEIIVDHSNLEPQSVIIEAYKNGKLIYDSSQVYYSPNLGWRCAAYVASKLLDSVEIDSEVSTTVTNNADGSTTTTVTVKYSVRIKFDNRMRQSEEPIPTTLSIDGGEFDADTFVVHTTNFDKQIASISGGIIQAADVGELTIQTIESADDFNLYLPIVSR